MSISKLFKNSLFALGLLAAASASAQDKLVIKGSDTLGAKLIPQMAEAYKAANPGVSFEIAAEGSSTGFAALIAGTCDIGMSSRKVKPKEIQDATGAGVALKEQNIAWDVIGILVNGKNPVKDLTKAQVAGIFTGKIKDWSEVGGAGGPISIYTRNTASGTYSDFKDLAMNKQDYAGSSQKMAGNEQIAAEVGRNPGGIGYVGGAYLNSTGCKVVTMGGAAPTPANLENHSYPYCRKVYLYTNGAPSPKAKGFIDFVLSSDKIMKQVGFIPLSEVK